MDFERTLRLLPRHSALLAGGRPCPAPRTEGQRDTGERRTSWPDYRTRVCPAVQPDGTTHDEGTAAMDRLAEVAPQASETERRFMAELT